ncbi:chaplin [Streptomyces lasalocidi]
MALTAGQPLRDPGAVPHGVPDARLPELVEQGRLHHEAGHDPRAYLRSAACAWASRATGPRAHAVRDAASDHSTNTHPFSRQQATSHNPRRFTDAGPAHADSTANRTATGSPGPISGNTLHLPLNVCGNTANLAATQGTPPRTTQTTHTTTHEHAESSLARTGTDGTWAARRQKHHRTHRRSNPLPPLPPADHTLQAPTGKAPARHAVTTHRTGPRPARLATHRQSGSSVPAPRPTQPPEGAVHTSHAEDKRQGR